MKTFKKFINESKRRIVWTDPDPNDHKEVSFQLALHKKEKHLPSWVVKKLRQLRDPEIFKSAVQSGSSEYFDRSKVKRTGNTGDTWKSTREWSPEKSSRIPKIFSSGKPIQSPIFLRNPQTRQRHLLGGHHRTTYATNVMRKPVRARVI